MKKTLAVFIIIASLAALSLPSAYALLSPGMSIIANKTELIKSGTVNNDIEFSRDDFKNVTGARRIKSVTFLSLPSADSGKLKLGDIDICENQTVSSGSVDMIVFSPNADVRSDTQFDVSVNTGKEEYTVTCGLRLLTGINACPVIKAEKTGITTYRDVSYYGRLAASDPDGDKLGYEITSSPRHGSVTITDSAAGSFKYTPSGGYTGRDSFMYRVRDEYGNYSEEQKISISIEKNSSGVFYCDMDGNPAAVSAQRLAEEGIMVGATVGGKTVFGPDYRVSRAEFLAMAMDACKIETDKTLTRTDFADNSDIPEHLMPYVATAKKLGYISGVEKDGKTFFYPNETVTRAEAAVIINKMLDLPTSSTAVSVFADSADIPAWAAGALCSLKDEGLMIGTGDGRISPVSPLTRAQAAVLICGLLDRE